MKYYISNSVLRWVATQKNIEAENKVEALQKYIEETIEDLNALDSFDFVFISKNCGADIEEIP